MKSDKLFIIHILDAINRIESYTNNVSEQEFMTHFMIQDAVIRNIQIIGEASKKISQPLRDKYTGIEWRKIAGMRNKVIHEYFGIDLPLVWQVVKHDLPKLKSQITKLDSDFVL